MSIKIHQYRTTDQIYLFQSKDEKTLTLKIYDLSRKRHSKESLQLEPSQIQMLFQKSKINDFLGLFNKELPPTSSLFGDFSVELDKVIDLFKLQVPVENKQTEKFTCPLTLEVLKDPVIDSCGHTFERAAIMRHQQTSSACPLSRQPIGTLIPNLQIRQAIEEWQKEDPIPTFSSFTRENENLASRNLDAAQESVQQKEYKDALDAYARAFQYTQNWKDYEPILSLFQEMDLPQKAHLATLYLVKYQLQAGELGKAAETLEKLPSQGEMDPQFDLSIKMLLIHLFIDCNRFSQAFPLCLATAQACEATHPQKAILLYRCILNYDPTQWEVYPALAQLLSTPQEKSQILLKGALLAIETTKNSIAEELCTKAERELPNPFIDQLVHLQLLNRPRLIAKLETLARSYEKSQDTKQGAKVYHHLATLKPCPLYQKKFLELRSALNPQKAIDISSKWLQTLLQEEDYPSAEAIAKVAFNILSSNRVLDTLSFYTALADLYRYQNSPDLEDILAQLAKIHQSLGNLLLAEKFYQENFQAFPTVENSLAFAQILELQKDRLSEAVRVYYEAAGLSLLQGNFQRLEEIVEKILQLDPSLKSLQTAQKVQLMTQKHLCQLTKRVQELEAAAKPPQPIMPVIRQPTSVAIPACAFGKAKWATHFGDIGVEPPLPFNINQILQGPCPIWPGKTVQETHVLVLIPTAVNGQPFTLKSFGELIQRPLAGPATKYRSFNLGEYQDVPTAHSYWTLMSRDVLEGSRRQNYETQLAQVTTLAQKTGVTYTVPKVLEAATCILMHHVSTGQKIFTDSPYTYTQCQEFYSQQRGWKLVVGGFSSGGLGFNHDNFGIENNGVGVCQKFLGH